MHNDVPTEKSDKYNNYLIQYPYPSFCLSSDQDWTLSSSLAVEMSQIHAVSCCRWHQAVGKEEISKLIEWKSQNPEAGMTERAVHSD